MAWETGLDLSKSHRFTVDHAQDFAFVSRVYQELCTAQRPVFSLSNVLELLEMKPEIARINAEFAGQSWHAAHLAELTRFRAAGAGVSWELG